jgi:hypothetical protein
MTPMSSVEPWFALAAQGQPSVRPPHLCATGSVVHWADVNSLRRHPLTTPMSSVDPWFALAAQGQPSVRPPHLRATGSVVHWVDVNSLRRHPLTTLMSSVDPWLASHRPGIERQGQG